MKYLSAISPYCISLIAVLGLSISCEQNQSRDKPNVLLIVSDDLGFSDLGSYGSEIETSHLDQLAKDGVRLTHFYTTGRCCPSRASLLTGQYPHKVGLGHMTKDLGRPGYQGSLDKTAITLGEILKNSGYRTFISGKWHLGTKDPTQHGFEEFYGTLVSAKTFWDPDHFIQIPNGQQKDRVVKRNFYGTDALTDQGLGFLKKARRTSEKPWFLYLAYNAPHFPLHAPKKDIAKYAKTYEVGWDEIRKNRIEKMKELGVIPEFMELPERSRYWDWGETHSKPNPAWNDLPSDRQKDLARRMSIYAAMIDVMDQNIGRLIADLKANGEWDNTLIIFLSDNGACAEWDPYGFDNQSGPNNILHQGNQIEEMGGPGTFHSVGSGWANASNTPFRLYKHFNHEGGISSPMIIHWNNGLNHFGEINHQKSHLIDVLPTILDAADITYPSKINSKKTMPIPGKSILPMLNENAEGSRELFFEHEQNRAVIDGKWKLVSVRDQEWELYDNVKDRNELNNLADDFPETVTELEGKWIRWAEENDVTPFPEDLGVEYLKYK